MGKRKIEEVWKPLWEFPRYAVSNYGRIHDGLRNREMANSYTNHGHVKISLRDERTGQRYTRSVALLVANAFVPIPDRLCDAVIQLDGNHAHVFAWNLAWRPLWFAWKYTHQLGQQQPEEYKLLRVQNLMTKASYRSIIECAMTEGLLFDDIIRSHYNGTRIYPHGHLYRVLT